MPVTTREYQNALMNHTKMLHDNELKNSKVTMNNGRPLACVGGCATVFQLENSNHKWAVKCFTKNMDRLDRYGEISEYINRNNHSFFVKFQYLTEGIYVQNRWNPIIKMGWIEGKTLGAYIDSCYLDGSRLDSLMDQWVKLAEKLATDGVAHCDYHSGNILVKDDNLVLVDYDSMFLPAFRNQVSGFMGDANFQHPTRNNEFNEYIDSFSSWIIYLTLRSIRNHSALWEHLYVKNDKPLIFKSTDYRAFGQSRAFQLLSNSGNDNVNIARFLIELTKNGLEDIPPFNSQEIRNALPNINLYTNISPKIDYNALMSVRSHVINPSQINNNLTSSIIDKSFNIPPGEKKNIDYRAILNHQNLPIKNKSGHQ